MCCQAETSDIIVPRMSMKKQSKGLSSEVNPNAFLPGTVSRAIIDQCTRKFPPPVPKRMAGWLPGWLAGWLAVWLDSWLTGWLAGWLVDWLDEWMAYWLSL